VCIIIIAFGTNRHYAARYKISFPAIFTGIIDSSFKIQYQDMSGMLRQEYTTLVLDLGGVLANYTTKNTVGLPGRQIKAALDSPYWHDYERGRTSDHECYESICQEFGIDFETWTEVLKQMKDGLQPNTALISSIKELRELFPKVKVFCLSNIPAFEFDALKDKIESWGIIDEFIASSAVHQRKPDMAIYEECLKIVRSSASSCIFVDDKTESVIAAQALGFKGIVFDNTDSLVRDLHNLFGHPVARAKTFLEDNAKRLFCTLNTGHMQPDNYSQLIILQNTGNMYVSYQVPCLLAVDS
jgi:FMN phosphatase YigB (HAD superfamily)